MDMASEDSLDRSIDIAVQHYSSLFRLPSHRKVLLLLVLLCIGGALVSTVVLFPSLHAVFGGLCLGSAFLVLSLIADYCTSRFILKKGTIFDFRRTVAVSLFCWGLWFFFIFLGSLVALGFGFSWWIRLSLLGLSAAMILRLLVFRSTAYLSYIRLFASSFFQPFLCILPFVIFFWEQAVYEYVPNLYGLVAFFAAATIVSVLAPFVFLYLLNRLGEKALGIGTLPLFRAFMLN